ncbi:MAG TPA: DNA-binding protein, partial [Myxococcota bacterium]|nr:DNA-binding protein [Myxococcota bacterium]
MVIAGQGFRPFRRKLQMPEKATQQRAARARRAGKSASTQAGEFVKEEIRHVRQGEHGAKSSKQAIAIGLNKARRSGVKVKGKGSDDKPKRKSSSRAAPSKKTSSRKSPTRKASTRKSPSRRAATRSSPTRTSATRSRAARNALKRQPRRAASRTALSRQGHSAARSRTRAER